MSPPERPERTYAVLYDGFRPEGERFLACYPIGTVLARCATHDEALELISAALDDPSLCFRCGDERPECDCVRLRKAG